MGWHAAAAAAAAPPREDDEPEWCGPHLASCWAWRHDAALRALAPVVALVGNELFQQLPTIGYGGIETSVDNTARALHQLGVPFFAVVPRVLLPAPEPFAFRVLETPDFEAGQNKLAYVASVGAILRAEREALGRPLVVWGQSDWSQDFSGEGLVAVTSHHDGAGPPHAAWDRRMPSVRHRFLSRDQMARWVRPGDATAALSRVIPHGLTAEAFRLCEPQGYFLWVAGLGWGWEGKGLDIFIAAAEARPRLRFVAYGSGDEGIAERLRGEERRLPNFRFGGPLLRGENHTRAFCGALAFFMPTHPSLGESFGLTIIESLSKGVPVIASTSGAVPEILGISGPGRAGASALGATCEGKDMACYLNATDAYAAVGSAPRAAIQAAARERFDMLRVVDSLLGLTIDALRETGAVPAPPEAS